MFKYIILIILSPFILSILFGIIDGLTGKNTFTRFFTLEDDNTYNNDYNDYTPIIDVNTQERIDNYDKQIDGYTQLIKTLDIALQAETDPRKRAAILSKQLTTLERLNKTIEKREKLDI